VNQYLWTALQVRETTRKYSRQPQDHCGGAGAGERPMLSIIGRRNVTGGGGTGGGEDAIEVAASVAGALPLLPWRAFAALRNMACACDDNDGDEDAVEAASSRRKRSEMTDAGLAAPPSAAAQRRQRKAPPMTPCRAA
jgi:hypothetical protein